MSLCDEIKRAQRHDDEAMMCLVEKFKPLLQKYARLLAQEDSYNDILLDFIDLVHYMKVDTFTNMTDGAFVNYISKTMMTRYQRRLGYMLRRAPETSFSELSEEEMYSVEARHSVEDEYFREDLYGFSGTVTAYEMEILRMIYRQGKTVAEIATLTKTTRQAVNQAKNRALKKLGQALNMDPT